MSSIAITLHLDAATALREGIAAAGPVTVRLTQADVDLLTPRQRETLAKHLERRPGWGESLTRGAPPVGRADAPTIARLLDLRADQLEAVEALTDEAIADLAREAQATGNLELDGACREAIGPAGHARERARRLLAAYLAAGPTP